jgi:rubrerythrin
MRRSATKPEPVPEILQGQFRYWRPKQAYTLRYRSEGHIAIGWGLLEDAKAALGKTPESWLLGLDTEKQLIEFKPVAVRELGSFPVNAEDDEEWGTVWNKEMAAWLKENGVPAGPIDARWQAQTGSIVGHWTLTKDEDASAPGKTKGSEPKPDKDEYLRKAVEEKTAELAATKEADAAPEATSTEVVKTFGHEWKLSEYLGPTGNPIYMCQACGYYTANPQNPILKERKCQRGLYDQWFEVRDDNRVYPKGWKQMTNKEGC